MFYIIHKIICMYRTEPGTELVLYFLHFYSSNCYSETTAEGSGAEYLLSAFRTVVFVCFMNVFLL